MRSRRLAPFLAVVAVALVALVAGAAGPVRVGDPVIQFDLFAIVVEPCEDEEGGAPRPRSPFQDCEDDDEDDLLAEWWDDSGPPAQFSVGSLVATLLVVLGAAALLVWLVRTLVDYLSCLRLPPLPRRPYDEVTVEAVRALQEAADLAAYEAESALPGRGGDAVVACWVLLEDAAARVGTPRGAPQTPTEFTADLLTEHQSDRAAVETLLQLYHQARFGSEPLPDEAAQIAGAALRRIAAGLSATARRSGGSP